MFHRLPKDCEDDGTRWEAAVLKACIRRQLPRARRSAIVGPASKNAGILGLGTGLRALHSYDKTLLLE
jgi:hypothetical protein